MAANHKLTALIKGRTIAGAQQDTEKLTIRFGDGSAMTVRTAGAAAKVPTGGTVAKVRQQDTKLSLDLADGSTIELTTAEATSSVIVRDRKHSMEYAD